MNGSLVFGILRSGRYETRTTPWGTWELLLDNRTLDKTHGHLDPVLCVNEFGKVALNGDFIRQEKS